MRFQILKNRIESFQLFWVICKQINAVLLRFPGFKVLYQQVKLAIKSRLFLCIERNFEKTVSRWVMSEFYSMASSQLIFYRSSSYKILGTNRSLFKSFFVI